MPRKTNSTFLYTHLMRWEPLPVKGAQGTAWIKTLSKDWETGARTLLIKYDPGFRQEKSISTWPADIYVIDGEMQFGDRTYEKGTYHYRPADAKIGPIESRKGITRLIFTSDTKTMASKKEVFVPDVNQLPWTLSYVTAVDPSPAGKGWALRMLREDKEAGASILMHTNFTPVWGLMGEAHQHDHQEEAFVLDGEFEDYCGDIDGHIAWIPGAYICRVPNASLHGDTVHAGPGTLFVRRTWTGDMVKFWQSKRNTKQKLPPMTFVE